MVNKCAFEYKPYL